MNIVFDNIIFSLQKAGGISIYWYELLKRFQKKKGIVVYESENENIFRQKLNILPYKESSFIPLSILRYLPFTKRVSTKVIFHSSYYRVNLQKNILNIVTVHDFTYEYFRQGLAKKVHLLQKNFAIKKADGIICVSKNTKKDLIKFIPEIDESRIKVIYNGVSEGFYSLNLPLEVIFDELMEKKYILYIGDRSSYKNFWLAVDVLEKLNDYYFVLVGGGNLSTEEKKLLNNKLSSKYNHYLGVSEKNLNSLYNNAFCLLYPSSYEGFGIPIVEAMKAGCPVISTNVSSIPEVAGTATLLVNEFTVNAFIKEIRKLENNDIRDYVIKNGFRQASKFSWDNCFNETYSFYNEVYNRKFS